MNARELAKRGSQPLEDERPVVLPSKTVTTEAMVNRAIAQDKNAQAVEGAKAKLGPFMDVTPGNGGDDYEIVNGQSRLERIKAEQTGKR